MKLIIGLLLILAGIATGLYFGVYWAFIGGIIQVIEQVRAETMETSILAIGIAKIFFAGVIGWSAAMILIVPGYGFIASDK